MTTKLQNLEQISETAQKVRAEGGTIVATNGCFDILHVGHVRYLAAAASLGDILVVGVNADDSVRELKGPGRPLNRAADRAEVLSALQAVDYVTVYPEVRATNFLAAVSPNVYTKGGDYTVATLDAEERAMLERLGARVEIIPFAQGYSTSELLTRISGG